MLNRIWIFGLLAGLGLASGASGEEMEAVLHRDTPLVLDSSDVTQRPQLLSRGHGILIIPELSSDLRLYIDPGQGQAIGWIDRSAVSWPDGTPIPGNPDEAAESQERANDALESQLTAGKERERGASRAGRDAATGRRARASESAKIVASLDIPPSPVVAEADQSLSRMLLGLVTDVSVKDYARTVAKDQSLSREEKVVALKLFYKYLQERRGRLSGDSKSAERQELERQSEDLLQQLASLDKSATARSSSRSRRKTAGESARSKTAEGKSFRTAGKASSASAKKPRARKRSNVHQIASRPHGTA
ncbi:MAG: hypothetical protein HY814_10475 [Candidatus Riflebacteria bacterium]|nr:hypothetical protein [Candidatus Riflebacteria bacterium]